MAADWRPRAWVGGTVALTIGTAALAIALAPPSGAKPPEALAFLLFVGSSVHVAATGWFYTVPEVRAHMRRQPARYVWWPLALITGAGATAVIAPRAALEWLLLPYFCWQFAHYQKQNLGIAALAASAHGIAPLTGPERRALLAAGIAAVAGLVARPSQLQLPVRQLFLRLWPLTAASFALAVLAGIWCVSRRARHDRPAGFCAAYLTSLGFGLPVFVFSSPYASVAGLTVAHGLQYLLLMVMVAAGGDLTAGRAGRLALLCNVALLGGAALAVASDQMAAGPGRRVLFGVFLGAVMTHFVVDAGLWRLREPFPRTFLAARIPYLVAPVGPRPSRSSADLSATGLR